MVLWSINTVWHQTYIWRCKIGCRFRNISSSLAVMFYVLRLSYNSTTLTCVFQHKMQDCKNFSWKKLNAHISEWQSICNFTAWIYEDLNKFAPKVVLVLLNSVSIMKWKNGFLNFKLGYLHSTEYACYLSYPGGQCKTVWLHTYKHCNCIVKELDRFKAYGISQQNGTISDWSANTGFISVNSYNIFMHKRLRRRSISEHYTIYYDFLLAENAAFL